MKKTCYIISAGDCAGININKNNEDYIIAVDGGYRHTSKNNIIPDMILGDFDSLGYIPQGDNVVVHQTEKDDTDTMLAVKKAMELGYNDFVIYGGLGGRLDHSYANLQVLAFISKNKCKGTMIDSNIQITSVTDGSVTLKSQKEGNFSVFSADSQSLGVTIRGAKYEVNDIVLDNCSTLGTSNEYVGKDVELSVKKGTLLIFQNKNSY